MWFSVSNDLVTSKLVSVHSDADLTFVVLKLSSPNPIEYNFPFVPTNVFNAFACLTISSFTLLVNPLSALSDECTPLI